MIISLTHASRGSGSKAVKSRKGSAVTANYAGFRESGWNELCLRLEAARLRLACFPLRIVSVRFPTGILFPSPNLGMLAKVNNRVLRSW